MEIVSGFLPAVWLLAATQLAVPATTPGDFWPSTLDDWQRVEVRSFPAAGLEELAATDAPIWREYGATHGARAVYRQGPQRLTLTAFVMRDPLEAYAAFTFFGFGGRPVGVGVEGRQTARGWIYYQGRYCITAAASPPANPLAALRVLARRMAAEGSGTSPRPTLLASLPRDGLRPDSERYLLGSLALARLAALSQGDWVGFAYGAEAVWAEYDLEGRPAGFLLASYPTPQMAATRLKEFSERFNLNGTGDPGRPLVYAKRAGPLLGLLAGVDSGSTAARLLNQLRYEYELTWSERTNEPTGSEWARVLANIFIGAGLMVLYALLVGLLFGGFRLLVQHFWPGKVFDRPEDTEILGLNLGRR